MSEAGAHVIIIAVILEGRSQAQVTRDYNVSQAWVSRLVARYRAEGDAAFEPRSSDPQTPPAIPPIRVRALPMSRDITKVELRGIEPLTSSMPWKRSTN